MSDRGAPTPVHVLPTPEALGEHVAGHVLAGVARARAEGRRFLLGCPTGRTPRPVFAAMAARLAREPEPLQHVALVMMDEYLLPGDDGLAHAPPERPWSCQHFARAEIVAPLDAALPEEHRLRADAVWFPDPRDPDAYERRIADAGGIDLFLLASGASDGHVAFNPPGSPRDSRTRVVALSLETRRDNLQTFPSFGTLDAVPHHGVSVGIATIAASREALMLAWGPGKRETVRRLRAAAGYEPDWPATVIHECARGAIVCDEGAAG